MTRVLERTFIAYLVGAVLGGIACLLESVALDNPVAWSAVALYTLAGGAVAALSRNLAELVAPGRGGRIACLMVLGTCGGLHLSYFVNVKLLPGEPYWTTRSLAADGVLLIATLVAASWGVWSRRAQALRMQFGRAAAGAGLLSLGIAVAGVAAAWPTPPQASQAGGEGPDLLVVVLDSARRDRLGLYGHSGPTSPALDLWAPRTRVFTRAYSASSWTVPSVEVLLQAEGARDPLAVRLAKRGYATACFTDNPHLSPGRPLLAGFGRVDRSVGRWRLLLRGSVLGESIERLSPGDDERLVVRSLRWIEQQSSPFFLFAHLMDSHTPYRHAPIDGRRRGGRQIEFPAPGLGMTREEAEDVVARYEGGVLSTDRAVGRLLDAMAARKRPWLAIVTSDHGESLGESGRWFHGGSLARELLEVPLLVAGTGIEPGRFDAVVGHADIPTTLAAAAGLDCPGCPHRGLDLRTSRGGGAAEGGLPPHLRYRIENDLKLVLDGQSGRRLLFDLRNDPEEAHDLAPQLADLAADFAARMGRELHADAFQPSPEDLERLRAVGYVGDTAGHSGSR